MMPLFLFLATAPARLLSMSWMDIAIMMIYFLLVLASGST